MCVRNGRGEEGQRQGKTETSQRVDLSRTANRSGKAPPSRSRPAPADGEGEGTRRRKGKAPLPLAPQNRGAGTSLRTKTGQKNQATGGARGETASARKARGSVEHGGGRRRSGRKGEIIPRLRGAGCAAQNRNAGRGGLCRSGTTAAGKDAARVRRGRQAGTEKWKARPGAGETRTEGDGRQHGIGPDMCGMEHGIGPGVSEGGAGSRREA